MYENNNRYHFRDLTPEECTKIHTRLTSKYCLGIIEEFRKLGKPEQMLETGDYKMYGALRRTIIDQRVTDVAIMRLNKNIILLRINL